MASGGGRYEVRGRGTNEERMVTGWDETSSGFGNLQWLQALTWRFSSLIELEIDVETKNNF